MSAEGGAAQRPAREDHGEIAEPVYEERPGVLESHIDHADADFDD
ncbi:hypothetical protein [Mycobacterium sp. 29Ha]|nr:hypothetical protein [Mycobacterium sp. 29Ha]